MIHAVKTVDFIAAVYGKNLHAECARLYCVSDMGLAPFKRLVGTRAKREEIVMRVNQACGLLLVPRHSRRSARTVITSVCPWHRNGGNKHQK
jgi:hypothetical protein